MTQKAFLATDPAHYEKLGITRQIQPFEDGLRTDPTQSGQYEWWYFDAHLDDGSTLVVTFYTKPFADPSGGLQPMITINLDLPDGRTLNKTANFDPAAFTASADGCDVRIAGNRFSGDLHEYTIAATIEDVSVDVRLVGQTEPWRPATGHIFYGDDESLMFAWLPSVPYGHVTATYTVEGTTVSTEGNGYHDHNWGNAPLMKVVNNWYWGRGKAGPYTFITAEIISEKKYGYTPVTIFMLAKDGHVIADDQKRVTFTKSQIHFDQELGKPVADLTAFTYHHDDHEYSLAYKRKNTILRDHFIDKVTGPKKFLARLAGFDGCYGRFLGVIDVTERDGDTVVEELHETAIWELMYFGKHSHETHQN
ncbi:lipocalin-like domain-containing protein [Arthrobacter woluwensis]|uniref:lipocalin-like domain-containing protein n=1 Tax=Arthrobacter woluwensis TaxID=156980 RepID=UPI001C6363E1|nr:lipocalin-like domain-containing protein [Arthrobacter woluwensis]